MAHSARDGDESGALAAQSPQEGALQAALDRLTRGRLVEWGTGLPERHGGARSSLHDTPDLHVTAVRRLPAIAARYAPFPAALDQRLRQALESRGISQLYTHQAESIEHTLAGRHVVVITPTA